MKFLTVFLFGFSLTFCTPDLALLEQIKSEGTLRAVTRNSPTTYYENVTGKAGLEYELMQAFAEELGVKLDISLLEDTEAMLKQVADNKFHFAAAGLTVNQKNKNLVRFGPSYQQVTSHLVYHRDIKKPPENLSEFTEAYPIYVVADSYQVDYLKKLHEKQPNIVWREVAGVDPNELLEDVLNQSIGYALVDSHEVEQMTHFHPDLAIHLSVAESRQLAWAFPRSQDDSLYIAAIRFFGRLESSGQLKRLLERYYGHLEHERKHFVDSQLFYEHVKTRLPHYRKYFEQIGLRYQLDWQFIAAIGYQESQWNPNAVSKTGVKGLMQLTHAAAEEVNVTDRVDPLQSIEGGAKYFLSIKKRINSTIPEPDRTWFTLAAYNIGLGHMEDARRLAARYGANPKLWVEVKEYLPYLSRRKWYRQTRYGYARGYEALDFVTQVRRFYDMLLHLEDKPLEETSFKPLVKPTLPTF